MRLLMIIVYLLIILLGISFATLNATSVQVNFYVKTLTMPISVLMTAMLGIGLLIGFTVSIMRFWRLKIELLKVKNNLKMSEKEVKNLRHIPLKDQH